jgi:uncharacterized protein YxjI
LQKFIFSLTDLYTVRILDKQDIFKINVNTFSLSFQKRVFDFKDNHLFTFYKKTLSFPKLFYAKSPAGAKLFEVKGKLYFDSVKAVGHFLNAINHEQKYLKIQESFFGTKTHITDKKNRQVIAEINKQRWNARQLVTNHGTYEVTVAPGVDMALIVAMVIYLDKTRQR